jgi:hypothetical protein
MSMCGRRRLVWEGIMLERGLEKGVSLVGCGVRVVWGYGWVVDFVCLWSVCWVRLNFLVREC